MMSKDKDKDKEKNNNKIKDNSPVRSNPKLNDTTINRFIEKIGNAESRGKMFDEKGNILKNPNGSAKGPFQFIDSTWGEMEKKLGRKLERDNWKDNIDAMKKLTEINVSKLEKNNIPVTGANLYIAHFLGDTGGPEFLKKMQKNPNELASKYVSAKAFKDNENIFIDKATGNQRTAAEVYNEMTSRYRGQDDTPVQSNQQEQTAPVFNTNEQMYNEPVQESTRTNQPRIDPSLNQSKQFTPRPVADNSVPEDNPVAAPKMSLGMTGSLDYLPKDFGLAFLDEDQLEQDQLGQDVNVAKYGGNQDTDPPKKKLKKESVLEENTAKDPFNYKSPFPDSVNNNSEGKEKTFQEKLINTANDTKDALGVSYILNKIPGVDTLYDGYNLLSSMKEGDLTGMYTNTIGALIPGVSGKTIESITSEFLPKTTEETKAKFKFIQNIPRSKNMEYLNKYGQGYIYNKDFIKDHGKEYNLRYGGEINNSPLLNKIKGAFNSQNNKSNNFEQGGKMRNTTLSDGSLNEFNEGGRHEENKYGGIPQGQGANGQMNTVEQGETKVGGYVLSDTLKLNDNDIKSLFLPKEIKSGMTFAEASKVVNDYLKEDPNNKILKKTVNKHIDSLTLGNEKARLAKEKLDLAMQQEMNPEMDPNQEMQLGEEFDQNQMFLGGAEMGMPGLTQGTQALTSLMAGDTDSAISGGLSAAGSIGGTLIGGPIGGAIGGAIGEGIGGLITGIGDRKKAQKLANKNHMIAAGKYNNDFRYGGPNGEQPFPVNGEGYGDDLGSIENLKSKETYIPQGPYELSGNFDTEPFDSNKAGVEYDSNKERLRREALERDNANALGKNPLQYAPILGNALSFLEAKNDKPSVIDSGRIDQRFNPRYADERTLQNIVGSELNNTTNALSSATNGSEGALRSNILGAGLNKAKAMSDAYMNIDNINRGQDNEADKFNYGVNAGNREAGYRDTIFNEGSKSATKDREISARNRLFDSIGSVGREQTYDNRLKNMTEYDSMGRYSPQIQSQMLELRKLQEEELAKTSTNTKRNGGFFSEVLNASMEKKKLSAIEEEFRKKYQ